MAAITKLSQKFGIKYRVTINMAGVRPFSRNFKTKKTAVAWAKKTEGDLEVSRVEGNNAARNLNLSELITELVSSRPINPATVIALAWLWPRVVHADRYDSCTSMLDSMLPEYGINID